MSTKYFSGSFLNSIIKFLFFSNPFWTTVITYESFEISSELVCVLLSTVSPIELQKWMLLLFSESFWTTLSTEEYLVSSFKPFWAQKLSQGLIFELEKSKWALCDFWTAESSNEPFWDSNISRRLIFAMKSDVSEHRLARISSFEPSRFVPVFDQTIPPVHTVLNSVQMALGLRRPTYELFRCCSLKLVAKRKIVWRK